MRVVVVMAVDGKRLRSAATKEADIFGALRHRLRCAAAADMAVKADHGVGRRHDDMQVVRNQQDAAAGRVADRLDQVVDRDLA